jgi:hypothetical protein
MTLPDRCPKCGQYQGWGIAFCGNHRRAGNCPTPHVMSDATEHLVITCRCCGYAFDSPCKDAAAPYAPVLKAP